MYVQNPYIIPSGITNEGWIKQFPALVPACVPYLGRYQLAGYDGSLTGFQINNGWPEMTLAITLPNAITLMNTNTATLGLSAGLSFDWTYSGFYIGDVPDVSNGTLAVSLSDSFTYSGIPGWSAPLSLITGNDFASIRYVNPLALNSTFGGGQNYPTWQLIITTDNSAPASGVTVGEIDFEVARNEDASQLRVRSLNGGAGMMTILQDAYATVTDAVYNDDGNITTPTQLSLYMVAHDAAPTNDSDVSFGGVSSTLYIIDTLAGYSGPAPAASGSLTIAGTSFGWVASVSNGLGGTSTTFSGASQTISPTFSLS